ncbi:MAG TPA: hypothetical protein VLG50_04545 [Candidatus Saccharimonadales bacterium]|nr:hypothetical protein [Candidatus Saccharimonadales bacterium]
MKKKLIVLMLVLFSIVKHVSCSQKNMDEVVTGALCIASMASVSDMLYNIQHDPIFIVELIYSCIPWVLLSCCTHDTSAKNELLYTASYVSAFLNMFRIGCKNIERMKENEKKNKLIADLLVSRRQADTAIVHAHETIHELQEQISLLQLQARQDLMEILQNPVAAQEVTFAARGRVISSHENS